ncbi:MAG TPA: UrcA family protein [Steroidobacteraceae bacterium]|nr:UrcA family protein [Steroidobacteraceae bacterium]
MNRKTGLIRTISVAALLSALPAALPAATLPSERVQISDLDLSTPQGQQRLEQRVSVALERVCPGPASLTQRSRALQEQVGQCRSAAMAQVQQQLRDAGLTIRQQARRD